MRKSIVCALAVLIFISVPRVCSSTTLSGATSDSAEHRIRLYHTHTGEHIDIMYRHGNEYSTEAEAQLDYFLRDHRTGDVKHYDPRLFDILTDLAASLGHRNAEIQIICGYR